MAQKKKVRLSDIASQLNISTVTVSKALSNKDGVSEDLRKQIKSLASQMEYTSKKTSNKNASISTGNIGIIIPSRYFTPQNSYYWYLFNYISKEFLSRNFYCILELISDEDENTKKIPRIIQDNKVDGVILLGQVKDSYIETIHSIFDNFILLDFYSDNPLFDSISNDNFYCSYILTKHIIDMGHKKLTFVGNYKATTSILDRYSGFIKALVENNISLEKENVIFDRKDDSAIIDIKLPQDLKGTTAFICNCDETAGKLIKLLSERGIKVPEDVSVTGFDNYVSDGNNSVPITTISINPEDTANVVADLLIKKITNQPYIKGRHIISGKIIDRESVKSF